MYRKMKFSESLKKYRDFLAVYRRGTSKANRYLVMYALENGLQKNRVGISCSKKVGNSVVRHTLTRRVREAYRLQEENFRRGYDFVFVVRAAASSCCQRDIEHSVHQLSRRLSVQEDSV